MVIAETEFGFRSFIASRGKTPETLLPEEMLSLGFEFFEKYRVDDTLPLNDEEFGDALLFQWGIREALPGYHEACFYFDLTRQFISPDGEDDDAMFQLSCTFEYEVSGSLRALGTGNKWCGSMETLPAFKHFALTHPALQALQHHAAKKTEISFSGI